PNKNTYEPIIKNLDVLNGTTFKKYIISKIDSYIGKSDKYLCELFEREYNNNKAQWSDLTYRMLGIKSNQAEEFVKANIVVKAIRIEENGKIRESMSFPAFKFKDLIMEEWEESDFFNYFNETTFLFVIFKKCGDSYTLKGSQIWNMPYEDLNTTAYSGWLAIRNTIKNGVIFSLKKTKSGQTVSNNLPKKSDNPIIHIRPHAKKSAYKLLNGLAMGNVERDANELPDGQWMTTQSFWINNKYILSQLNSNFIK
ncbi:MAG: restriction endonuclease, partial [Clostridium sp.]|nr:restriction endonuclease [Clostridium sp.]